MKTIEQLQEENAALAAQVEALRTNLDTLLKLHDAEVFIKEPWDSSFEEARKTLKTTPQQHLAEALANTAEKFYYMGWEHSLSTKSDDGDHYACGKRLAKSFADGIRQGGAV